MRQHPPRCPSTHDPTQRIEDLLQVMPALRCLLLQQRQVWRHELPFVIADIGRVRLAGNNFTFHPPSVPSPLQALGVAF